jgi:hypothetical protein
MTPHRFGVCVVGWHLNVDLLRRLRAIGADHIHLASHRPEHELPRSIIDLLGADHVHIFPNRGYDWGAFRQFTDAAFHRAYEYCFFMHDDVEILDDRLFDAAIEKLEAGASVVGNGRNSGRDNWFVIGEGFSYAHARTLPPSLDFAHETVRGSFLGLRSQTIDALGGFDVFWDPLNLMIETGNLSLKATAARIAAINGEYAFAYLGDREGVSPYMIESVRGGAAPPSWSLSRKLKAQLFKLYKWTAGDLVCREIAGADPRSWRDRLQRRFVAALSGNDACLSRGLNQDAR